jgi:RNA polymerase sigma-70 factor (ECF subfamily)
MDARQIAGTAVEDLPERRDETTDVEHEVGARIEAQEVRTALRALPAEQRRAIELAYFGGHSHSEIAGMLGIPLGTVKGRLRIGLQKLRTLLHDVGLEGAVHDA